MYPAPYAKCQKARPQTSPSRKGKIIATLRLLPRAVPVLSPPLLTLALQEVPVPRRRPRELGPAVGARRLGGLARLFALVAEEVAEGRELAPVAAVLPALGLGAVLHHADVVGVRGGGDARGVAGWRHDVGHGVYEGGVASDG